MKKFTAFLAAALMSLTLAGCDTDKGYIAPGITDMGTFAYQDTVDSAYFFGEKIKLTGKYDDLGSSYSVANGIDLEMNGGASFDLLHNGDVVGTIVLKDCEADSSPKGKKIEKIELSANDFKLNGISNKSSMEDVRTRFGAPDTSDTYFIKYYGKGDKYIEFTRVGVNGREIVGVNFGF